MKIDIETQLIVRLLEKWLAEHPDPERPVFYVPDSTTNAISPRRLLDEVKRQTPVGKLWAKNLLRAYIEAEVLSSESRQVKKRK